MEPREKRFKQGDISLVSVVLELNGLLGVGGGHGKGSMEVLHTVADIRHTVARVVLERPRLWRQALSDLVLHTQCS